jgi:hypothetical protein
MYHGHGRVLQHQHVHPYHPLPGSMQLARVQPQVALLVGVALLGLQDQLYGTSGGVNRVVVHDWYIKGRC